MTDADARSRTTPAREDVEEVPAEDIEVETVEDPAWVEPDSDAAVGDSDELTSAGPIHGMHPPTSASQPLSTATKLVPEGTARRQTRDPSSVAALLAPSPVLALVLTALAVLFVIIIVVGLLSLLGVV